MRDEQTIRAANVPLPSPPLGRGEQCCCFAASFDVGQFDQPFQPDFASDESDLSTRYFLPNPSQVVGLSDANDALRSPRRAAPFGSRKNVFSCLNRWRSFGVGSPFKTQIVVVRDPCLRSIPRARAGGLSDRSQKPGCRTTRRSRSVVRRSASKSTTRSVVPL